MTWTPPATGQFQTRQVAKQETVRQDASFVFGQPRPEPETNERGIEVRDVTPERGPVRTWSPSLWKTFSKCQYAVFLRRVKKVKTGPKNEHAERGIKVHDNAERYVRGDLKRLPTALKKFKSSFLTLRENFDQGLTHLEEDWVFSMDWEPVEKFTPEAWAWFKLDAFVFDDKDRKGATIIDYKTGKKFGNEADHGFQGLCYAIAAFMRFTDLQYVRVEFWYVDSGDTLTKTYTRAECISIFIKRVHERGIKITTETDFIPSPSANNCRWCDYAANESCEWANLDQAPSSKYKAPRSGT